MKLDTLRIKLPLLANSLDQRWRQYVQSGGRPDTADFLAHLVQRGVVTEDQARDALAELDVALTLSEANRIPDGPRYHSFGLLGRGAMGEVHLARDRALGRNVAVKALDPSLVREPALAARFHQEAQITAQLDHPGIVPVYSIESRDDGAPAYSMKLVRGKELADAIKEARAAWDARVPEPEDLDLNGRLVAFLSVCDAMAYAHERGVLHRDLKPSNIMLGAHHEVLVMDWGIAKILGEDEDILPEAAGDRAHQTQVGTILGTPNYMSPEQAEGDNNNLTAKSDQYALGLILQELVTLNRAVSAKNALHAVMRAQAADRDPMVHYAGQPVPRELVAIVDRACQPNPDDRYEDVEAFVDDIRRYLRDEPVLAAPDTSMQKLTRWVGRNRQLAVTLGVSLLGLVFVVTVLGVLGSFLAVQSAQVRALEREEALMTTMMRVTEQAGRIDSDMSRYESLVTGMAFAAEEALDSPAPDIQYYKSESFSPPDLVHSDYYDDDLSLTFPDVHFTDETPPEVGDQRARQLASVAPALVKALLQSRSPDTMREPEARRRALVANGEIPAVWAYVATEEGVIAGMPGIAEYAEGYDPRTMAWYQAGRGAVGPTWTALELDEGDMGLLLTCLLAVRDSGGEVIGVAALDLGFAYVVEELLAIPDYPNAEVFLVDRSGNVVASSAMKDIARKMKAYTPEPLPYPEVVAMLDKPAGHAQTNEGLFVWRRLQTIDWAYVVKGSPEELLEGH